MNNIWQYIQGSRKGKEAHLIEKEAMKDPFLADALEGFENNSGNHQKEAAKLQRQVIKRQKQIIANAAGKKPFNMKAWGIAASILIVVGLGAWFVTTPRATIAQAPDIKPAVSQVEVENATIPPPPVAASAPVAAPPVADQPKEEVKPQQKTVVEVEKQQDVAPAIVKEPQAVAAKTTAETTTSSTSKTSVPELGMDAYNGYITRNLVRPTDDECRNVKGTVVVEFKVGQSGRPYNIRVTQGLCTSANKEAIRLIINGPRWKRGTESDDAKVNIQF